MNYLHVGAVELLELAIFYYRYIAAQAKGCITPLACMLTQQYVRYLPTLTLCRSSLCLSITVREFVVVWWLDRYRVIQAPQRMPMRRFWLVAIFGSFWRVRNGMA